MDNIKHMVTIPFKDYEDLIQAKKIADGITSNVQAHIDLLRSNGIVFQFFNVGLRPKKLHVAAGRIMGGRNTNDATEVTFEY